MDGSCTLLPVALGDITQGTLCHVGNGVGFIHKAHKVLHRQVLALEHRRLCEDGVIHLGGPDHFREPLANGLHEFLAVRLQILVLCHGLPLACVPDLDPCDLIRHIGQICDDIVIHHIKHSLALFQGGAGFPLLFKALAGIQQMAADAAAGGRVEAADLLGHGDAGSILQHLVVGICVCLVPLAGHSLGNAGGDCANTLEAKVPSVDHGIGSHQGCRLLNQYG